jgi:hypothetical protein
MPRRQSWRRVSFRAEAKANAGAGQKGDEKSNIHVGKMIAPPPQVKPGPTAFPQFVILSLSKAELDETPLSFAANLSR